MNEDGSFCAVRHQDRLLAGLEYYDYADRLARQAWHEHDQISLDWMWYLWCGRYSPLSGRVVKTFERTYLTDRSTWEEPRDPYFRLTEKPEVARTRCTATSSTVTRPFMPPMARAPLRPVASS